MARERGGQPGNRNALKHGFFSSQFTKQEKENLNLLADDLTTEIAMLRVVTRRFLRLAKGSLAPWHELTARLPGLCLLCGKIEW